jgi:rubrerythrin
MDLGAMLDRCCELETRSAALYRKFAAGVRDRPDLCALWSTMAREEDDHARTLNATRGHLPVLEAWITELSPRWDKVVRRIEAKLSEGERLADGADIDQQLATALELEMTEIEPLRQMLIATGRRRPPRPLVDHHISRLVDAAERHSRQPSVRRQAELLRARMGSAARGSHP